MTEKGGTPDPSRPWYVVQTGIYPKLPYVVYQPGKMWNIYVKNAEVAEYVRDALMDKVWKYREEENK